jgi:hypothetical protein
MEQAKLSQHNQVVDYILKRVDVLTPSLRMDASA